MVLHALHLCSGYGGFELALRLAGVPARTVAHVERDTYAAAALVARMEEAHLDQAPVWSDLSTFDAGPWAGRVDLVTAGFPCQPFSAAGAGRGVDDERWLWPAIGRLIGELGPRLVFLENVPGLVQHGLPHVLSDLAQLGFDAEWGLFSAAEVGAPHKRDRFWLLAHANSDLPARNTRSLRAPSAQQFNGESAEPGGRTARTSAGDAGDQLADAVADADGDGRESERRSAARRERDVDRRSGAHVGHAGRSGRPEVPGSTARHEGAHGRRPHRDHVAHGAGEGLADTDSAHSEGHWGAVGTAAQVPGVAGISHGCQWPPTRDDRTGWERWVAAGGPEPAVLRSVDERTGRMVRPDHLSDRLHLLGNGLVPVAAAHAFVELARRLSDGRE